MACLGAGREGRERGERGERGGERGRERREARREARCGMRCAREARKDVSVKHCSLLPGYSARWLIVAFAAIFYSSPVHPSTLPPTSREHRVSHSPRHDCGAALDHASASCLCSRPLPLHRGTETGQPRTPTRSAPLDTRDSSSVTLPPFYRLSFPRRFHPFQPVAPAMARRI